MLKSLRRPLILKGSIAIWIQLLSERNRRNSWKQFCQIFWKAKIVSLDYCYWRISNTMRKYKSINLNQLLWWSYFRRTHQFWDCIRVTLLEQRLLFGHRSWNRLVMTSMLLFRAMLLLNKEKENEMLCLCYQLYRYHALNQYSFLSMLIFVFLNFVISVYNKS